MKISARNVLSGTVVALTKGPVSTEVTLEIAPGLTIVSTITTHSAEQLQLAIGSQAFGLIKASSVMIGTQN